MFIDEARISVKAGDGGHGCIAFRREKFVPRGGPSGGNGGRGGHIYFIGTDQENTLLRFRYERQFRAERGRHGEGSNRKGRDGEDVTIEVPVGTLVHDDDTAELIHDFTTHGEQVLIAEGGRGGHGNAHFATSTNRAPKRAQDGAIGQQKNLRLELKLLADVGLVGFPNAGKSTLISRISAARPKIADYPFTTLEPHLGVVSADADRTFVVADIPGLIEGAHSGHGLGIQFLRHIERTRILLQLVDVSPTSERDPVGECKTIEAELELYNPDLVRKPRIVVATKLDVADSSKVEQLEQWCGHRNLELIRISSVTGEGLERLKRAIVRQLSGHKDNPEL